MKTKRILITLLICLLATSVLFGMIACKKQGDRPLPDPVDPSQSTNDPVRIVREMLEALPDAATFGAADVPALENALEAYANLSDDEKKDVSYAKAEALLKKAVYLDASTVSFFPQSKDGFTLKPYLTGKNVLTVKVGEDDLYYGQYTVKANEVEISTAVLKKYVPSVVDLEITTDVGANYIYKIYAGMKIDEAYEVKSCTDTELDDNVGDGLAFIAEKGVGSKTLLCFSKYDGTLKYDFSEGRVYNLYFDFTIPENSDGVALPVYFEGIGGDLCTIGFHGGLPYIDSVGDEAGKYATISYLGDGIYRLYTRFTSENGCNTLVVGLDGSGTSMQIGNVFLYPLCGQPVLEKSSVSYDVSQQSPLALTLNDNGGEIQSVKISNKSVNYSYDKGVLQIPQTVFDGFDIDSSYDVKIETQFGYAVASVTLLDGVPVITGDDYALYSADSDKAIAFSFDLKGKTFESIRVNGAVVAKENYTFDGETLTFVEKYLTTLYSVNRFEMTFRDCRYKLPFTIATNYIYKSSFAASTSDADLEFAPDGIGSVVEENGINWARYYNPGQGTVMILRTNTFQLTEEATYKLSYKMKIGSGTNANWWSPVFTSGHDLLYIRQNGGALVSDDVYPAGNPLGTVYSFEKSGDHYEVSVVFTARSKGVTPLTKLEFASWGGSADLYFADIAIEKYSEKVDVLLLGSDLLSSGYWSTYKKDITLYTVANKAKIGNTIDDCMEQLDTVRTEYTPRKIVLSIGENDLYGGMDANAVKVKYSKLIEKIKEVYPASKLYVLSIIKTVANNGFDGEIEKLNVALQTNAETKGYKYVDISFAVEKDGVADEDLFLKDGLHISRNNYAKIADAIKAGCMLDGTLDALFIGDSYMSVAYWSGYEKDMAAIDSVNLGVGGTQTAYWEEKIAYLKNNYSAETIIIHIGVNDIDDGGADSATATRRIKNLLDHLHEAFPESKVVWMTISPNKMFEHRNYIYPPVNEAITGYSNEVDWLTVIDVAEHFTGDDGKYIAEYYLSDGMHLNSLGYELFVGEIRKALGM